MDDTCCVCIETFTKQAHRKQAKCPYCDVKACTTCTQTYLLGTTDDPHCMGCRRGWTREVLDQILLTTWVNGAYKKHRENILMDRERSRLPAAQIIVERQKQAKERQPLADAILEKIGVLQREINILQEEYYTELRIISQLNHGLDPWAGTAAATTQKSADERRVFIMPCPAADCRGFLSQAYKCGVCDVFVCPECREVKGLNRDAPHTCNPDTVASVQRLKKECRGCPECGTQIFKIEGCFRMDTPVRLWNGGVKMSQDIIVGDELIGDDGNKRTVLSLVQGEDALYEVKQTNGESYVVNSKHTLVLKYSGDRSLHWNEGPKYWKVQWFDRELRTTRNKNFNVSEYSSKENALKNAELFISSLTFPEEIELTIEQYNALDKWTKRCMMGFKSSAGVNYNTQEISLDPYLLGLWLGDGTHSHPIIASNDIEVQLYILDWCKKNDAELVHDEGVKFRIRRRGNTNHKCEIRAAIGVGSKSESCVGCKYKKMEICDTSIDTTNLVSSGLTTNPLTELLKKYNLLNNKHIPSEYMMNSRDIRLKLLAGLIDTDGNAPKEQKGKRIVITQTESRLAKDIEFLAKSLGFVVNVTKTERKNVSIFGNKPKDFKDIYKINISGEKLCEIPTLIPRKKCAAFNPNKDYQRTSIEVSFKETGKYYGWSVDGNKRFLHSDFTVLRNCDQMFCTNCNTPFSWTTGKKVTTGAIHNPHYFEYLRKMNNGVQPRTPGDIPCLANLPGAWEFDRHIRKFHSIPKVEFDALYKALMNLHHIHAVEIPYVTNRAEDNDSTDYAVRYLLKEIDETRWKQLLQQKEKKRLKKDEIRQLYEALIAASIDIFGRLMALARGTSILDRNQIPVLIEETKTTHANLLQLVKLFNQGMMEISRRYKCKVLVLNELTMARESKKFVAPKKVSEKKKKTKTKDEKDYAAARAIAEGDDTDDDTVEEIEDDDDEAPQNVIVQTK